MLPPDPDHHCRHDIGVDLSGPYKSTSKTYVASLFFSDFPTLLSISLYFPQLTGA
jgi:hypothetical protein